MIQYLRIQNLALLEEAALQFDSGFSCVTGETGAGKSVLLGALSLLSGARTDKSLIREGAETCTVEAGIYLEDPMVVDAFLAEQELPACEEGALILRRSFSRKRIPVIQINGATSTLAVLKDLGELWIDFHGPGEPQKLFKESVQLELLDAFARGTESQGLMEVFAAYQKGFSEYTGIRRRREQLEGESQLSEDEQDFLKKQLKLMETLPLNAEAIEALERDYQRASSSQELMELAGQLEQGLSGGQGVGEQLSELVRVAQELPDLDPEGQGLLDRLHALVVETEDLAESFRDLNAEVNLEESAVEELETRMQTWMDLKRKYGGTVEAVEDQQRQFLEKLEMQGDLARTLAKLEKEESELEKRLAKQGKQIQEVREKVGKVLAEQVVALLNRLGFKKPRFSVEITPTAKPGPTGGSTCSFRFAPNAGQSLQPLNKIASSGETARVMLALKTLLAEIDQTPVLVFDEVDANVGGEIGQEVGLEMRKLGERHQVLCVTHLPQVASQGHWHYVVAKSQDEDSTEVEIEPIHEKGDARVQEIARMLGDRKSKSALEHAEALLSG